MQNLKFAKIPLAPQNRMIRAGVGKHMAPGLPGSISGVWGFGSRCSGGSADKLSIYSVAGNYLGWDRRMTILVAMHLGSQTLLIADKYMFGLEKVLKKN